MSWHNSDIHSPNLEALARDDEGGIILENSYVQPICTPTRAALLTGYYPIHSGRQVRGRRTNWGSRFRVNLARRYTFCCLKSPRASTPTSH